MKEVVLMKDHRRKYCLLLAVLLILSLSLMSQFVSGPSSYDSSYYVSDFISSTEIPNSELLESDSLKSYSGNVSSSGLFNLKNFSSISNHNVSITILSMESDEKIIKLKYSDSATTIQQQSRNVFVKMENINKTSENIFFIESRCATEKTTDSYKNNKGFVLNARQCCAIESTALTNLNRHVFIFHSCPLSDDFISHSPKFVEKLFNYPNVHVVRLNFTEVFLGSPLQDLYKRKQLETSQYPVEHASDLLRLTLLWKFGGTYCDLDVVTIRSLTGLNSNWAGMQDVDTIANGVLNFEPDGVGHDMLHQALEHINKHFDGTNWSTNGPLLITPIILGVCNVSSVTEATKHCHGNFTVYTSNVMYPLYYNLASEFFNDNMGKQIVKNVKSTAYSVHIWNKMSHGMTANVGSTQAYALLAEEFCPEVYRNCGAHF